MKQHRPGYWDRVIKIIFQNALLFVLAWFLQGIAVQVSKLTGGYHLEQGLFPVLIVLLCLSFQLVALWFWDNEKDQ